jgi:hypothetical protein
MAVVSCKQAQTLGYRMRRQAHGMCERDQIVSNSVGTASPIQELSIHRLLRDSLECTVIAGQLNKVEAHWLLSNVSLHRSYF